MFFVLYGTRRGMKLRVSLFLAELMECSTSSSLLEFETLLTYRTQHPDCVTGGEAATQTTEGYKIYRT